MTKPVTLSPHIPSANDRVAVPRPGRTLPKIGECGLEAEDTGIDRWLSGQFEDGVPSDLIKVISIQTFDRVQMRTHGIICGSKRGQFLADIGLSAAREVELLARYGWVYLSHLGVRG